MLKFPASLLDPNTGMALPRIRHDAGKGDGSRSAAVKALTGGGWSQSGRMEAVEGIRRIDDVGFAKLLGVYRGDPKNLGMSLFNLQAHYRDIGKMGEPLGTRRIPRFQDIAKAYRDAFNLTEDECTPAQIQVFPTFSGIHFLVAGLNKREDSLGIGAYGAALLEVREEPTPVSLLMRGDREPGNPQLIDWGSSTLARGASFGSP